MPTARTARLTLAGLAAAALAGCGSTPTGPEPASSSPLLSALEVTAEPAAERVDRSGFISVTVRVVNRSRQPVTLAGSGGCGVRLEVRDSAGQLAGQSRNQVCTLDCRTYVFAPGQAFVRETRFYARYFSNDAQREVSLPPGTYQLVGRVDGDLEQCGGTPAQTAGPATVVEVR